MIVASPYMKIIIDFSAFALLVAIVFNTKISNIFVMILDVV